MDPHEMNNLYGKPGHEAITEKLKKELVRLQTELGDDPNDIGDKPNLGVLEGTEPVSWEEDD